MTCQNRKKERKENTSYKAAYRKGWFPDEAQQESQRKARRGLPVTPFLKKDMDIAVRW